MNEEKQVAEVTEKEVSVNADDEKTKISKYYLEYRFIPYIVSRFNQKDENPKLCIFACQKLTHTKIAVRGANAEALMSSRN